MTSATNWPFAKCSNGHDLTGEDAYVYTNGGLRKCRMCVSNERRREKSVYGAFDGGM